MMSLTIRLQNGFMHINFIMLLLDHNVFALYKPWTKLVKYGNPGYLPLNVRVRENIWGVGFTIGKKIIESDDVEGYYSTMDYLL